MSPLWLPVLFVGGVVGIVFACALIGTAIELGPDVLQAAWEWTWGTADRWNWRRKARPRRIRARGGL